MQVQFKNTPYTSADTALRTVTVSLHAVTYFLLGQWEWELHSNAVYCSDVMAFPADFEGTRCIFYPDDLPKVKAALALARDQDITALHFRVITTFGELKMLSGKGVSLFQEPETIDAINPGDDALEEAIRTHAQQKETTFLRLHSQLAEMGDRIHGTGTWYCNKATGETWYSDNVYRIHGVAPQSLNAHANTFNQFIHPDDRAAVLDAFDKAFTEELPLHVEYRIVRPEGILRQVRQVTHWTFNDKGQVLFCGALSDITEQEELHNRIKEAQTGVRVLQAMGQFAERQAAVGYWYMNMVTRKIYFSENYLRIHGIKAPFEPSHRTFLDLVHPDDRALVSGVLDRVAAEQVLPETEYRTIRPDGRQRVLRLSGKLSVHAGAEPVMMGVVQDITEQRNRERKLEALAHKQELAEQAFQLAGEHAGLQFIYWFPGGQIKWSEGMYPLLGYKPYSVEPSAALLQKAVHEADQGVVETALAQVSGTQPVGDVLFQLVSRSGVRHMRLSFRQLSGTMAGTTIGLLEDHTSLVLLQQQAATRDRYNRLIENAGREMILLTNKENAVVSWNASAESRTGVRREDALFANLFDLFPHLRDAGFLAHLNDALAGREVLVSRTRHNYMAQPHSYRLVPFTGEQGAVEGVLHVVQDISRELDMQQQLGERLAFIENLLAATVDRIVVLDRHMNYLYWNPRAEQFYGLDKQKVLGKNILEIFPGFRNDPSYQEFRRALKGETVHLPATLSEVAADYFETYLIPIKDEDGAVNAVLWMVHDLGKELELQQERERHLQVLKEQHRRLTEAQALGKVGSFEWVVGAEYTYWSDELYRIAGLEAQSEPITIAMVDAFIHPDDFEQLQQIKNRSLLHPGNYKLVHRIVLRTGEHRWVNHEWESIAGDNGAVVRVTGIVQDISEEIAAQERLRQSESLLRSTEAVALTGSYEANLLNDTFRFSDGLCRLFGEVPGSFVPSLSWIDSRSFPDDIPVVKNILDTAVASGDTYQYTRRIYRTDGALRTLEAHGKVLRDARGKAVKLIGLVQDITEKSAAAAEARSKHELLQATMNNSPDMIQVFKAVRDEQGNIVDFIWILNNEASERQYGDVIGKSLLQNNPGVVVEGIFDTFKQVVNTGVTDQSERHYEHEQFSGWYLQTTVRLGDGVATTTRDITESKLAARALQESKDLLQGIINAPNIGLAVYRAIRDENGAVVNFSHEYVNDRTKEIMGQDITGWLLSDHGPEGAAQLPEFVEVLHTGQPNAYTKRLVIGGKNYWMLLMNARLDQDRLVHVWEDITSVKEAEEEIVRLKEEIAQTATSKYQVLFNTIDEGFCIIEILYGTGGKPSDYRWLEANAAYERHTGQKIPTGLVGKEVFPEEDPIWLDRYSQVASTGNPVRFESWHQPTARWYHIYASRLGGSESRQVAIVFHDITERHSAEQALLLAKEQYHTLFTAMDEGYCIIQMLYDDRGQANDWRFIEVNPAFEKHNGLVHAQGKTIRELTPGIEPKWVDIYNRVALTGESIRFEEDSEALNRVFDLYAFRVGAPEERKVAVLFTDITQRRRAEQNLQLFNTLLEQQVAERTAELQQNMAIIEQSEALAGIGSWTYEIDTGRFLWSDRMYELFGKQPGEAVQPETYLEAATDASKPIAQKIVDQLKAQHQSFEETLHIQVGGAEKILRVKGAAVAGGAGKPARMVGVDLDITNLVNTEARLRESQALLEQTIAASPDAIIIFDVERNQTQFLNQVLARWTGYSPEALQDIGFEGRLQWLHPEDRSRLVQFNEQLKGVADDSILTMDYRLSVQGSTRWVRNRSRVFLRNTAGQPSRLLTILQDVSLEYNTQATLNELNASLQQKNRELEMKNEEITSFAFISSHDLKEPIRKIHTFADMLRIKEGARLSEEGQALLSRMGISVKRLNYLIEDILSLSRIHTEHAGFEQVALQEVIEKVRSEMADELQHADAAIICGELPPVYGIQTQLFYLFKNLLGNAIKFQEPGNKPVVHIHADTLDGSQIRQRSVTGKYLKVEVADNGIGFDPKYKAQVFRIFQRLHNKDIFGGTGMGLAICRKVMENHRGFIDVDSRPGKGTTFCCYFPV